MTAREALEVAIKGGAKNLGRDDIGEIAPGFAADFVAWRADAVGFGGALHDPIAALMLCTPDVPHMVVINGDFVLRDGKFPGFDIKVREHFRYAPAHVHPCA